MTNITGLNEHQIEKYVRANHSKYKSDVLGELVVFDTDHILDEGFFCKTDTDGVAVTGVVMPGDLVVVDEVWRFWGSGCKLRPDHLEFFRMHRHYVDPAGVSSDLVVITQDVTDLDRKLKNVIETTYRMEKLKSLGAPKRYVVFVFQQAKVHRKAFQTFRRKFDPAVFALYSSYDGKGGDEKSVDARQNIFSGGFMRYVIPFAFTLVIGGGYGLWRFFHPEAKTFLAATSGLKDSKSPASSVDSKPLPKPSEVEVARFAGVLDFGGGHRQFLVEIKRGMDLSPVIVQNGDWKEGEDGLSIKFRGAWMPLSGYTARVSRVLNSNFASHDVGGLDILPKF